MGMVSSCPEDSLEPAAILQDQQFTIAIQEEKQDGRGAEEKFDPLPGGLLDGIPIGGLQETLHRRLQERHIADFTGEFFLFFFVLAVERLPMKVHGIDLNVQRFGKFADLFLGGRDHFRDIGETDPEKLPNHLVPREIRFGNVGREQVCRVDDLDEREGVVDSLQRLVVIANRIDREGIQAPAVEQPGADLGVGDPHLELPLQEKFRLVPGGLEHLPVFFGKVDPEDHSAHIVKDTGEKRKLGGLVGCLVGKASGQDGTQQGVPPVEFHVEKGLAVDLREYLVDGGADGDIADGVATQLKQGVIDSDDLFRAAIEG